MVLSLRVLYVARAGLEQIDRNCWKGGGYRLWQVGRNVAPVQQYDLRLARRLAMFYAATRAIQSAARMRPNLRFAPARFSSPHKHQPPFPRREQHGDAASAELGGVFQPMLAAASLDGGVRRQTFEA